MGRPRSDIAPRIVAAARQRFLVHGVDGASLRDIARDAKTSVGMVHYYFKTKEDLFLAAIEDDYARMLQAVSQSLASGPDDAPFAARVQRLYRRFAAMSDGEITVLRLVLREVLVSSERRRAFLERSLRGHIPVLLDAVIQARARGELDDRPHPIAQALTTLLLGLLPQMFSRLAAPNLPPAIRPPGGEDLARQLGGILLHGLVKR